MPQSFSCILIHTVFSTKHRDPCITENVAPDLYKYMATILKNLDCHAQLIGGTEDHVHILHSLSRTTAPATVIEELKSDSSKWIKKQGSSFTRFYWQTGYGSFSIGQSNVAALKRYISNQKEHHKIQSFQDEYLELLRKYNVKYDERYMWD